MSNILLPGCDHVDEAQGKGVPKEYVHLHREESVLVTGWSKDGDDQYSVGARWPAAEQGLPDPLLLTQTIRQSCLVIAHAERSVPLSHQTLMERMDFSLAPGFRALKNRPVDLLVKVSCRSTGRRSMRMELTLLHEKQTVATSVVSFSWIAPAVYRRLRGEYLDVPWGRFPVPLPAPVEAHTVGRADTSCVVLAATDLPGRWQLRTDVDNKVLYDHPVDHVPALALIEGACQAAQGLMRPAVFTPVEVTSWYDRYIEFDAPCWIEAVVDSSADDGRTRVEVTGVQRGATAFRVGLVGE
ncbi:ScbA/BarX family gamma-butyrolactone biosynthesis protein [Streptomyces lanatus]|uniref:ScbA/BarX family gamma-butyrolactone biosynthesis protein n=1 Tax=Streptomyces lanatus TaxID=66900 RepID=A0ABV1Y3Z0_9ACTN|nr:ScbA/BarX family gamma-butyrolactone biosynthesis protein [Streptomyces lanatus]GHH27686.1 adhesin [Streptomyces lanatus]